MKIRLSYSLLNMWDRGEVDKAIESYFRIEREEFIENKYLVRGKNFHNYVEKYIKSNKKFPKEIGSFELLNPKPEKVVTVNYNKYFDLKIIIDCLDGSNIYEYKTGSRGSLYWTTTMQLPMYFFVCDVAGIKIDKAFLVHRNTETKETDWTMLWNTKKYEGVTNYIDTIGSDIYQNFKSMGLI